MTPRQPAASSQPAVGAPSAAPDAADLAAGKLEQVCTRCQRREAAGRYCTGCYLPMTAADWRRTVRSEAQRAASSLSGRRSGFRGVVTEKTAKPAALADGTLGL